VIRELSIRGIPFKTVFTGQHKELFEDVKDLIPNPDYKLEIMKKNQTLTEIMSNLSSGFGKVLLNEKPDLLIVQGDTSTVAITALMAFYEKIFIGHVEAGLRTYDLSSPFPEEGNRQIVSRIAKFNWAPTQNAANQLMKENAKNIIVTGNTVIDACVKFNFPVSYEEKVLVTLHRRENFGTPMKKIFTELNQLAKENPNLEFIFPLHPNPNVQKLKSLLQYVNVIAPLGYSEIIKLLSKVKFVISDSGGIQEECAAFKKKVLVCRNTTERPEGIDAGFAKLVHTDIMKNFNWANDNPIWIGENPFGDGNASKKIISSIVEFLSSYEKN
jgi:UDP-N-acetylglucosamine 2-epimerase (non-hydrolysing)